MKYLMTHLSVHLHGEKVLNAGSNVKKITRAVQKKRHIPMPVFRG